MPVAADHPVYAEVTDAPCAAVPRPVDQRVDQPVGTHPARSAYSGFAGLDDVGESSTDTAELWMTGMSRQEATAMLTRAAVEGGFLVRPSSNSPSGTAVSVGPRHAHAWCSMLPRGNCERAPRLGWKHGCCVLIRNRSPPRPRGADRMGLSQATQSRRG